MAKNMGIFGLMVLLLPNVMCDQPRIAIIGGGIGGVSTSYFLYDLLKDYKNKPIIDIYESDGIGSRYERNWIGDDLYEMGDRNTHTSIKLLENLLMNAELVKKEEKKPKTHPPNFGIWNGETFDVLQHKANDNKLRLEMFRALSKARKTKLSEILNKASQFQGVDKLSEHMTEELNKAFDEINKEYLAKPELGDIIKWTDASKMVNYGRNKALLEIADLLAVGVTKFLRLNSVKQGYKEMLINLFKKVKKDEYVSHIRYNVEKIRYEPSKFEEKYEITHHKRDIRTGLPIEEKKNYDIVIIATRNSCNKIEFEGFPSNFQFDFAGVYQTTFVTLMQAELNSKSFGLAEGESMDIFSSNDDTKFYSLTKETPIVIHNPQDDDDDGDDESSQNSEESKNQVWKIMSSERPRELDLKKWFHSISERKTYEWQTTRPVYTEKDQTMEFKVQEGLFFVNAVEKISSLPDIKVLGAKVVAEMVKKQLEENRPSTSFVP